VQRAEVEAMVRQALARYLPDGSLSGPTAAAIPSAPRLVANISARHCHLNADGVGSLFGRRDLKVLKPLYQEGAFAAEETVAIFGPRKQMISNVRVLGPLRDECQVELASTEARFLGIDAPIRLSGNIEGTPGCYLVGPAGGLELKRGVIRAARHAHMNAAEAAYYGVANGDRMRLVVVSGQSGYLDDVLVRVSEGAKLEVHVDTDEGNALDLVNATEVRLEKT
jgi:propanediol utilization protein